MRASLVILVFDAIIKIVSADYYNQVVYDQSDCTGDAITYVAGLVGCNVYEYDGDSTSYQLECLSDNTGKILRYTNGNCSGDPLSDDGEPWDDDVDSLFGCSQIQESTSGTYLYLQTSCGTGDYVPPDLTDYIQESMYGGPDGSCLDTSTDGIEAIITTPTNVCMASSPGISVEYSCNATDVTVTSYSRNDCSGIPSGSDAGLYATCIEIPGCNVTKTECVSTSSAFDTKKKTKKMTSFSKYAMGLTRKTIRDAVLKAMESVKSKLEMK
jgi:hypothetical protein